MVVLAITLMNMAPEPISGNRQSLRTQLGTGTVNFELHALHSTLKQAPQAKRVAIIAAPAASFNQALQRLTAPGRHAGCLRSRRAVPPPILGSLGVTRV